MAGRKKQGRGKETPRTATRALRGVTGCRRRPTLPRPLGRSTIGAVGLNDRVRDGNGCGPYALVASEVWCSVVPVVQSSRGGARGSTEVEKKRRSEDGGSWDLARAGAERRP